MIPLDYSKGFGGKYGVQKDRVDKAAVDWNYEGKTEAHASQKGLLHSIGHCHRDKTCILFS